MCAGDTRLNKLGDKLMDNLYVFFEDIQGEIKPSVLHGDLWSGNIASVEGQPSIFDPATYYGHHEAEFGMSWCAGERFYEVATAKLCCTTGAAGVSVMGRLMLLLLPPARRRAGFADAMCYGHHKAEFGMSWCAGERVYEVAGYQLQVC
jgi:hypothetical protein